HTGTFLIEHSKLRHVKMKAKKRIKYFPFRSFLGSQKNDPKKDSDFSPLDRVEITVSTKKKALI
ncbi:MAG: hypothetical protein Q8862_13660, partial [Bacteroidota bacterium]|nr:hypothetical protein [Bacteroidota bacterium]